MLITKGIRPTLIAYSVTKDRSTTDCDFFFLFSEGITSLRDGSPDTVPIGNRSRPIRFLESEFYPKVGGGPPTDRESQRKPGSRITERS